MVKTQADKEDNQSADHLGPWVQMMYPGVPVEIKKDVHGSFLVQILSEEGGQVNMKLQAGS